MKVRLYNYEQKIDRIERAYLKAVVKMCAKDDHMDYKAVCSYSNKHNLKGIKVYAKGSKSLLIYIDLLEKKATYYKRGGYNRSKKVMGKIKGTN